jgi:hypothetical protein
MIVAVRRQSRFDNAFSATTKPELTVTKYCLALTNPQHSEIHVRVGEFPGAERAFQLAELIALDLGIDADGKWQGWTVEVRGAQGRKLFAAPVTEGDLH